MATPHLADTPLRLAVHQLRREVRQGRFRECLDLADECYRGRAKLVESDIDRERIHTLNWEVYEALGEYRTAHERLMSDGVVAAAAKAIKDAVESPSNSIAFPDTLKGAERKALYDRWRQKVMCVLALGLSAVRLQLTGAGEHFRCAQSFLDRYFAPASFACNGTRARLHFFRGWLHFNARRFPDATVDFVNALDFLWERLHERAMKDNPDQSAIECAFATYCLGRIQLALGDVEYCQGAFSSAKRHLKSAKILLRTTPDPFLIYRADLLLCLIARAEEPFGSKSRELLKRCAVCANELQSHPVYHLEASIEKITTAVYLIRHAEGQPTEKTERAYPPIRRKPPASANDGPQTFHRAFEAINPLIDQARDLGLKETQFHAMLVKARILNRLKEWGDAAQVVDDALALYKPLPSYLVAEADYVRAKTHEARGNHATALEFFRSAFACQNQSSLFHAWCSLHILELLENSDQWQEALRFLPECEVILRHVESKRANRYFEPLKLRAYKAQEYTIHIGPGFRLADAFEKMEDRYLNHLAALAGCTRRHLSDTRYLKKLRSMGFMLEKRDVVALLKRHPN